MSLSASWRLEIDTLGTSELQATFSTVLKRVRRTGEPVLVTRFSKPMAEVVPAPERPRKWLASLRDRGEIFEDLVPPAVSEDEWDAVGQP